MSDLLIRVIRDALTGKPVTLGILETPKLMQAIQGLKNDPAGRLAVFAAAVRACADNDPALRDKLLAIAGEIKLTTGRFVKTP